MKKVVLASGNEGKLVELQAILAPMEWQLVPQSELKIESVDETGLSFIENAIIKARHASEQSGLPALADDSGLVVKALNGEPGIYSARYAGAESDSKANMVKLLEQLAQVDDNDRQAYFYCVIAYVDHASSPTPLIAEGRLDGMIAQSPCGEEGFGYDPVFFLPQFNMTTAQLPNNFKNKISHRAKALNAFKQLLETSN